LRCTGAVRPAQGSSLWRPTAETGSSSGGHSLPDGTRIGKAAPAYALACRDLHIYEDDPDPVISLERLMKKAKTISAPNSGTFWHIIDLAKPLGSHGCGSSG
jgi:hypothetical protein